MAAERLLVAAAMAAVGVVAAVDDVSFGMPLALGAAAVVVALLVQLGALAGARNQRALDLIAEGRGELPVHAIARMRARLLDPAQRERLARSIDVICCEAERPLNQCHPVRPLYSVAVVKSSAQELAEVAALVRDGGGIRGLARAEQLVTDGGSALYGDAVEALRQELGRIRFLLAG